MGADKKTLSETLSGSKTVTHLEEGDIPHTAKLGADLLLHDEMRTIEPVRLGLASVLLKHGPGIRDALKSLIEEEPKDKVKFLPVLRVIDAIHPSSEIIASDSGSGQTKAPEVEPGIAALEVFNSNK